MSLILFLDFNCNLHEIRDGDNLQEGIAQFQALDNYPQHLPALQQPLLILGFVVSNNDQTRYLGMCRVGLLAFTNGSTLGHDVMSNLVIQLCKIA